MLDRRDAHAVAFHPTVRLALRRRLAIRSPSEPVATPEPAATPEPTPVPSLSADEAELIGRLRADSAADCAPRRTDLPAGALYGIECDPGDPLVQRVGVYRYATANDAAFAYMTRMGDAGIAANTGDCLADTAGDSAYFPGDGESPVDAPGMFDWEGKALVTQRNGCFLDEFDSANVRLVCENDYIGILGNEDDLSDLHELGMDLSGRLRARHAGPARPLHRPVDRRGDALTRPSGRRAPGLCCTCTLPRRSS